MRFIMMYPPRKFLQWYIDEHDFLQIQLIDLDTE